MPQPLVLAIEPDLRQAAIVKRIVREKVQADVMVVDSRDAALDAMRTAIPDVLLLSALMSPREEDELVAHLRTLENADHLQTHTIPLLASVLGPTESRGPRGLLSAFRRKKETAAAPAGCDPDHFAEEIRVYLQRAADLKRERSNATPGTAPADNKWRAAHPQHVSPAVAAADQATETASTSSSWSSPFEWKPSSNAPSPMADPESPVADPAPVAVTDLFVAQPEPFAAEPEAYATQAPAYVAEPESFTAPPESRASDGEIAPASPLSLMAHLRPPAGIPSVDSFAVPERPVPVDVRVDAPAPIEVRVAPAPIEVRVEAPMPIEVRVEAPMLVPEPVLLAPIEIAAPALVVQAVELAPAPVHDSALQASRIADARPGHEDSGLGIRDQRSAMKDQRLGALASWARTESRKRDAAHEADDLRALLTSLAVPSGVVAVGYGRGCRIRRVRVPTAREPHEAEAVGAVILSRTALAERRNRREQPGA